MLRGNTKSCYLCCAAGCDPHKHELAAIQAKGKGMNYIPCRERLFPFRINVATFYLPYLRWLRHLGERLGIQNALSVWGNAFAKYDEALLIQILSSEWHTVISNETNPEDSINTSIVEIFPATPQILLNAQVRGVIENTPPISQIRRLFSSNTMEKEITAFDALHLRFDGLACLAESLIDVYGKQGEFIVYDLMAEARLAFGKGETGSVEEFIDGFSAESDSPDLFSAGLQSELIGKTKREVVMYVRECEWSRYFQERHPTVGYLMACSTDEISYKAFNKNLRMQRTLTLMESGEKCDFRIYAIDDK